MEISLDPQFSLYRMVEREKQASIILTHHRTMQLISHKIEQRLLQNELQGRLFAGFQKISHFLKRQRMYEQLAAQMTSVVIFAEPDVTVELPANITIVPTPAGYALNEEWFLVFEGLKYFTALCGRETILDEQGNPEFNALWLFDLEMIHILAEWLGSAVGQRFHQPDLAAYDLAAQQTLMDENMEDLLQTLEMEEEIIQQELNQFIHHAAN